MTDYKKNIVQKYICKNNCQLVILTAATFIFETIYGLLLLKKGYFSSEAHAITTIANMAIQTSPFMFENIIRSLHPLLALLQIPVLWILSFLPAISPENISGTVTASFFSALSSAYLYYKFKNCDIGILNALFLTFLFILNPFIFHYGAVGTDTSFFSAVLLICSGEFSSWLLYRKSSSLVAIALALAICLFNNYEIIIISCVLAIMIAYSCLFMTDPSLPLKNKAPMAKVDYMLSTLIVVLLPLAYAVFIIMLQGWMVFDTPFYFMDTIKNAVETNNMNTPEGISAIMKNYYLSCEYAIKISLPFLIIWGAITLMRIFVSQIAKKDYFLLLFFIVVITIFNITAFQRGFSSGISYDFYYVLPICAGWLPYEIEQLPYKAKKYGITLFMAAFIACGFLLRGIL